MQIKPIWLSLISFLLFFFCSTGLPHERDTISITLKSDLDVVPVTSAQVFEDKDHELDWQTFHASDLQGKIPWKSTSQFNYGYTTSRYWFKVSLRNLSPDIKKWYLEFGYPLLQKIRLFIMQPDGSVSEYSGGRFAPMSERLIDYRTFVFPVVLAKDSDTNIYLSAESAGTLRANFRLLGEKAVISATNRQSVGFGIYYGVMFGLIFYNLFLFFALGDRTHLYYVLYASSFCTLQAALAGHAFQYLWRQSSFWDRISVPFLVGFSFLFFAVFTRSSLDTKRLSPRSDFLILALGLFAMVLILVSLGDYALLPNKLASLMVSYAPLLVVPAVIVCIRSGSKAARFYAAAFVFFFLGAGAVALKDLGALPVNFFTLFGMHLGSAVEAVFFSITLAYRVRFLQEEKLMSQFQAASAKQQLAESELQLQNERALSIFATQVAHDIRSPLSALNIVTAALKNLPEENRQIIRSAVQRINDISNGLLNRGKQLAMIPESTQVKSPQASEPVMLIALVDSVLSELRIQLNENASIQIQGDLAKGYGLFATVPGSEFARTISNLVSNAIEACDGNGMILVSMDEIDGQIRITIQDNGRGIPASVLNRIGERGFSHGKEGTRSGSGLGVFHARTTIENAGGRIAIESTVGAGTKVTLTLPKCEPPV